MRIENNNLYPPPWNKKTKFSKSIHVWRIKKLTKYANASYVEDWLTRLATWEGEKYWNFKPGNFKSSHNNCIFGTHLWQVVWGICFIPACEVSSDLVASSWRGFPYTIHTIFFMVFHGHCIIIIVGGSITMDCLGSHHC